jgi:hypothetical protein
MANIVAPEVIVVAARCTISGTAHGYLFEGELVQTVQGRLLRRRRNDLGPPLAELRLEPVDAVLDLRLELDRLRDAPPLVRPDHRWARLELRVGAEAVVIQYPRPLIGDSPTDHPADRLYTVLWEWPAPR